MSLSILFLEPFFGGSHRDFAEGLIEYSRHSFTLHTLPARFWKWRMRGASLHFARKIEQGADFDLILATDLMSIADLKMMMGKESPPILLYMHENQLSYPLPEGEKMDYQYGFTDITSCLAADAVVFNSRFHYESFFAMLPDFLHHMPEYKPMWVIDEIRRKASVLYPGCRVPVHRSRTRENNIPQRAPAEEPSRIRTRPGDQHQGPPLIIWNHRWEFDKGPDQFFSVLEQLKRDGYLFRLAVLGENFQVQPKPFLWARDHFHDQIVHYGYVPSREAYLSWLQQGDIVVSTSIQENFGIAVVEAVLCGCRPLLPARLAYPELIPREFHDICLYSDEQDLYSRLHTFLSDPQQRSTIMSSTTELNRHMEQFSWENRIHWFDRFLEKVGRSGSA
jgi:glycosyltransferase involved in cell wall biosynthesis